MSEVTVPLLVGLFEPANQSAERSLSLVSITLNAKQTRTRGLTVPQYIYILKTIIE